MHETLWHLAALGGRNCLAAVRNVAFSLQIAAAICVVPDEAKAAGIADALLQSEDSASRRYAAPGREERVSNLQGQEDAGTRLNDFQLAANRGVETLPPDLWESLVGACTGGMFSGAVVTEMLSMIAIASGGAAVPLAAGAVASAAAVGCGVSMISTAASHGSKAVWRKATH